MDRFRRLAGLWLAPVGIAILLVACGGGDDEATGTPIGGDETAPAGSESLGEGTVDVDGTEYSFTVSSCVTVNDTPNLGGEGDANITLQGNSLLVQLPSTNQTFSVAAFDYSLEDQTITGSGTGSELGAADSMADIQLTATCSQF